MTTNSGPVPQHSQKTTLEYLRRALEPPAPPRAGLAVVEIYDLLCQFEERMRNLEQKQEDIYELLSLHQEDIQEMEWRKKMRASVKNWLDTRRETHKGEGEKDVAEKGQPEAPG